MVAGSNSIYNIKTNQVLVMQEDGNMNKFRSYLEPADCQNEHETIEGAFDKTTFQELRSAIFANFKKNLQEGKNLPFGVEKDKGLARDAYRKENFTTTEWDQVKKEVEEAKKNLPFSKKSTPRSSENNFFSQHPKLIILTGVGLVVLVMVVLLIIRKTKRRSSKKKN